jgi:hypothetical protein
MNCWRLLDNQEGMVKKADLQGWARAEFESVNLYVFLDFNRERLRIFEHYIMRAWYF